MPNRVNVDLSIQPETRTFACRYQLTASFPTAQRSLAFNVNRKFRVTEVQGPHLLGYTDSLFYDAFQQDTLRRLTLRFAQPSRQQTVTVRYNGTTPFQTDSVLEFTAHANWLPTIPDQEYALVRYRLAVHIPAAYQVISTGPARRAANGTYVFTGQAPNIELTAVAARRFTTLGGRHAGVELYKANRPFNVRDSLLRTHALAIIAYQNRIIGRRAPIRRFRILLPGSNRNAFGLLDNAAVITYSDFDTRKPADLLILAHEISHKWWGWGTWNTYDNWLNEGFATYSGLLYLRATADTATFRQQLLKHRAAAAPAPPILQFDARKDMAQYRAVIYSKGTVVLADLHTRLGDEAFFRLLQATAAAHVNTTQAFLALVEQKTGRETRDWLAARLGS
ncbi:M1 family metallopeptidase [Hymenobacter busanensis]|uniref:M1 family metallopeptidase n=1 Tax=Hymenobacter busanensis TaxID=2607656 RepID=A0A7L4ZVU4_9BACT|nr:M1 family metallopeptidase [Hymenobacter busanensis]KAA9332335.1 M1 family metallopeptidase [Hymenobacter busanensis]QHJ07328.1 hypothetical protein GUY19_08555 [Hymenobacter busanensis]